MASPWFKLPTEIRLTILYQIFADKKIYLHRLREKTKAKKRDKVGKLDLFSNIISLRLVSKHFATSADIVDSILSQSTMVVYSVGELDRLGNTFSQYQRQKITSFTFSRAFGGPADVLGCFSFIKCIESTFPSLKQIHLQDSPYGPPKCFLLEMKDTTTLFALVKSCQKTEVRGKPTKRFRRGRCFSVYPVSYVGGRNVILDHESEYRSGNMSHFQASAMASFSLDDYEQDARHRRPGFVRMSPKLLAKTLLRFNLNIELILSADLLIVSKGEPIGYDLVSIPNSQIVLRSTSNFRYTC